MPLAYTKASVKTEIGLSFIFSLQISLLELKHAGCKAQVCCRLWLFSTDAASSDMSIQLVMGRGVCACFPQMWIIMYLFRG